MSDGVVIIGVKEFDKVLKKFEDISEKRLDVILQDMAFNTQNVAIKSINSGGRTGRSYTRRSVTHIASAAGEPPKTDTGQLVRNITVNKDSVLKYSVGSRKGAPYGAWLELGTRTIAPRPWLKPAFDQTLAQFRGFFK
jgi:HK97 gp10 family phage protein